MIIKVSSVDMENKNKKSLCSRLRAITTTFFTKCFLCSSSHDDNILNTTYTSPSPPPELHLMCSYNGRLNSDSFNPIYRGGENRIIAVDRRCTAEELRRRLSTDFLNGRSFSLKYHISSPGLNALVSVVTDEDLRFMVEEYDRLLISSNSVPPPRPPPTSRLMQPLPGQMWPMQTQFSGGQARRRHLFRVFLLPPENGALSTVVSPTANGNHDEDDFDDDDFDDEI